MDLAMSRLYRCHYKNLYNIEKKISEAKILKFHSKKKEDFFNIFAQTLIVGTR